MRVGDDHVIEEEEEIVKKMTLMGLWCIQTNPCDRPPMKKVVDMLEGGVEALVVPPKPLLTPAIMAWETVEESEETSSLLTLSQLDRKINPNPPLDSVTAPVAVWKEKRERGTTPLLHLLEDALQMHLPFTPNRLVNLSNGGHTAEMLSLLSVLRMDRYTPRFYIAAATDNMSLQKARSFEHSLPDKLLAVEEDSLRFTQIYRSREVGQSYVTSVWTTIVAIVHALWLMIRIRPQVILCNGPGTCIPLCVIAFLFKVLGIRWSSIFYVESVARVKKLSLSGLLLYNLRMADQFFVQWPQLQKNYPRAHYVACLM
ncbi:hypothetical protein Bca4012_079904 [Brassica carinata]